MQKFLSKYGTALHLAILASASLFLYPFCSPDTLATVLLWLTIPAALWVLLSPSIQGRSNFRDEKETLTDARWRVFYSILRDPITWLLFVVLLFTAIRWMNGGVALVYDAETSNWLLATPHLPFLPGSSANTGALPFATMLAFFVLFIGCRHSLGKKARIAFLVWSCAVASVAVIVATFMFSAKDENFLKLASLPYETYSFAGSTFGIYFLIGVASLVAIFEAKWNKWLLLVAFIACAPLTGLYCFAPHIVIIVYLLVAIALLICGCIYGRFRIGNNSQFKVLAGFILGVALPVACVMGAFPSDLHSQRFSFMDESYHISFFTDTYLQLRTILSRIAKQVWVEHPWIGTGLSSFSVDVRFKALADDWLVVNGAQQVSLNGWWYILVERGIVGVLVYAITILGILVVFIHRLIASFRSRVRIFWPMAFLGPLAVILLVAEGFMDVSFLRPDATLITGALLALSCKTFPDVRKKDD